jgi:hypothetical protein
MQVNTSGVGPLFDCLVDFGAGLEALTHRSWHRIDIVDEDVVEAGELAAFLWFQKAVKSSEKDQLFLRGVGFPQ